MSCGSVDARKTQVVEYKQVTPPLQKGEVHLRFLRVG